MRLGQHGAAAALGVDAVCVLGTAIIVVRIARDAKLYKFGVLLCQWLLTKPYTNDGYFAMEVYTELYKKYTQTGTLQPSLHTGTPIFQHGPVIGRIFLVLNTVLCLLCSTCSFCEKHSEYV